MATDWSKLEQAVTAHTSHGSIDVSVMSPSGECWEAHGDKRFPAASTVKIPIMIEIYRGMESGELALDDTYIVRSADKAPGSGVLQHMHAGLQLSLGDLLYLMMSISDNTATNHQYVDRRGRHGVHQYHHARTRNARLDTWAPHARAPCG